MPGRWRPGFFMRRRSIGPSVGAMRFIFLGTGTSAGVPSIACDCDVCRSDDPHDTRLRTAAAVQFTDAGGQDRTILIDTSPDLRQQALRARLDRCDGIVFTHNHVDHTFGLDEVRRFNVVMQAPIDVYAEDHTLEHLRSVFKHIFDKDKNVNKSFVATLIAHQIEPGTVLELYGMRFTAIRLLHGRLPILGFRIEPTAGLARTWRASRGEESDVFPLGYCTDVSGLPPESWRYLEGLKTLVLDALRVRHHPTHLTLDKAVEIAARVEAGRTFFVHMSHDLAHEATNEALPETMALAHDGLILE